MGGKCEHKNIDGSPSLELFQGKSGNQYWECKYCGHKWDLPFQIHKLSTTPIVLTKGNYTK